MPLTPLFFLESRCSVATIIFRYKLFNWDFYDGLFCWEVERSQFTASQLYQFGGA